MIKHTYVLCILSILANCYILTHLVLFNEKLQWLKLYDRHPEYTQMVDKATVKEYVASIIGEKYIIPTLGVWENFDDIDFENIPSSFVLKCTHDSGGVVICENKNLFDVEKARSKLLKSMKKTIIMLDVSILIKILSLV